MAYDRYSKFKQNNQIQTVPYIKIRVRPTDLYTIYRRNHSRLDLISYEYYGDASFGWLILQANPDVPSCEYEIPDNTQLRIPYPLMEVLNGYDEDIEEYKKYYGIDN